MCQHRQKNRGDQHGQCGHDQQRVDGAAQRAVVFLFVLQTLALLGDSLGGELVRLRAGVGLPCLEGCKILICRGVQQVFISRQRSGSQSRIDGMSVQRSASAV